MSFSFPYGLVTSETGDLATWVQNTDGVRNIFISDKSEQVKQTTSVSDDDGQEMSELIICPDNHSVINVCGGAPNRRGEIPNPLSCPEKVKREILKIDFNNDSLQHLSDGFSPTLSHDGNKSCFSYNFKTVFPKSRLLINP